MRRRGRHRSWGAVARSLTGERGSAHVVSRNAPRSRIGRSFNAPAGVARAGAGRRKRWPARLRRRGASSPARTGASPGSVAIGAAEGSVRLRTPPLPGARRSHAAAGGRPPSRASANIAANQLAATLEAPSRGTSGLHDGAADGDAWAPAPDSCAGRDVRQALHLQAARRGRYSARSRHCRRPTCAGRARRTGTPWRCRGGVPRSLQRTSPMKRSPAVMSSSPAIMRNEWTCRSPRADEDDELRARDIEVEA